MIFTTTATTPVASTTTNKYTVYTMKTPAVALCFLMVAFYSRSMTAQSGTPDIGCLADLQQYLETIRNEIVQHVETGQMLNQFGDVLETAVREARGLIQAGIVPADEVAQVVMNELTQPMKALHHLPMIRYWIQEICTDERFDFPVALAEALPELVEALNDQLIPFCDEILMNSAPKYDDVA